MIVVALLIICCVMPFAATAASIPLVKNSKPVSEIVLGGDVNGKESEALQHAGSELQKWLGEMTGAYVPVRLNDDVPAAPTRIVIQSKNAKKLFPKDWKAIGSTDGFAVRTNRTESALEIHLFGTCMRGALHAVYAFLEANSDIIWPRSMAGLESVHSVSPDFTATDVDFIDIPKSQFRYYQWHGSADNRNARLREWESRNRMNAMTGCPAYLAPMFVRGGGGHGMMKYAGPKENFKTHPEWFTQFNGERTTTTGWVCFCSDPEGLSNEFLKNISAELQAKYPGVPPEKIHVDEFNLSGADNWNVCQCEKCTSPFVCEDGTVIQPDNPVFRSAQAYTFLNILARKIKKVYPDVTLGQYAYYITEPPPPFRLESNIHIQFCPYGENMKAPLSDLEHNSYWGRLAKEWGNACGNVIYRSYNGCGEGFPRAVEYIVQSNATDCLSLPLPMRSFKTEGDEDQDFWKNGSPHNNDAWDMCAMFHWVQARLWWNPYADIEKLRSQYVARTYREAAGTMMEYYDVLRDSFFSDMLASTYNGSNPVGYTKHYVAEKGLSERILALLDKAMSETGHPVSKELIRRHKMHFSKWIEAAGDGARVSMTVPYSDASGLDESFDSDVWEKAGSTGDFVTASDGADRGKKPIFRTTAKLLHDRSNFYVRFDCYAPDAMDFQASVLPPGKKRGGPRGDIVEFYFANADSGVYWMSMMDPGNPGEPEKDMIYFAKLSDGSWDGGWTRKVRRYQDRWVMIVKIPFDSIGLAAAQNFKLQFQAVRQKFYFDEEYAKKHKGANRREFSSWNGGWVHAMADFGDLNLGL